MSGLCNLAAQVAVGDDASVARRVRINHAGHSESLLGDRLRRPPASSAAGDNPREIVAGMHYARHAEELLAELAAGVEAVRSRLHESPS